MVKNSNNEGVSSILWVILHGDSNLEISFQDFQIIDLFDQLDPKMKAQQLFTAIAQTSFQAGKKVA